VVQRGRQLGRLLGFPTANVSVTAPEVPAFGVYATRTRLPDGRILPGVASLGLNPTIGELTDPLLEVWIFDFDEDLYDKVIETELLHFIRPEAKFPDLQSLTAQVKADAEVARSVLVLLNQKAAAAGDSCGLWNC
jgi:riboflavin kinase/FMN adenylyltransferase